MQSIVRKFIRKIARKEINYEVKLSYVTGALAHIAGYHAAGNKGCMISTIVQGVSQKTRVCPAYLSVFGEQAI